MKFFAVASTLIVAVASEAQIIAPYANYGYGAPLTALNTGYINAAPVAATYAAAPAVAAPAVATVAAPAVAAVAAPAVATYAAAPAVATYAAAPAVATYAAAPVAAPTVASSQFQAQDENRNFAYGYQNINSAKQETGNALTGVTGSYTYADEAGVHTVNYVADALGFRASGNNLPVAPIHNAVAPVHDAVDPVPVVDTPEVVEARAAFFKAYDVAKSGIAKRSAQLIAAPAVYGGLVAHSNGAIVPVDEPAVAQAKADFAAAGGIVAPAPYAYAAPIATYAAAPAIAATYAAAAPAIAAPVAAYSAAPAVAAPVAAYAAAPARDAVLTTIKLNPGHATFYRVD